MWRNEIPLLEQAESTLNEKISEEGEMSALKPEIKRLDQECIVFWNGETPHLNARQCDRITFNGEDLYNLRKDLSNQEIHLYIEAFYRILTSRSLVENIKTLPSSKIRNIIAGKGVAEVAKERTAQTTPGAKIMFNYEKNKEVVGFEQKSAIRYLAYLDLARSVPRRVIPIDMYEANAFYKKYFDGEVRDVFTRLCKQNGDNIDEILDYYRQKLNWSNLFKNDDYLGSHKRKLEEKKPSTFAAILAQLTRTDCRITHKTVQNNYYF